MPEEKYEVKKTVPIQFRITKEQFEMLKKVAHHYGDRVNNVARLLFINAMMKEESAR